MTVLSTPGRTSDLAVPEPAQVLDSASGLVLVTDGDLAVITYASARCNELLGTSPDRLVGRALAELVDPSDHERVAEVAQRVRTQGHAGVVGFATSFEPGRSRLLEAEITVLGREPRSTGLTWTIREFTGRHRTSTTGDVAMHDELTDLPNRAMFLAELDRALQRHLRTGTELAVAVIGLEGVAAVWERTGHRAAQDLVVTAAGRLDIGRRPGDLLGRIGVDILALAVDDVASAGQARDVVGAALHRVNGPVDANGCTLDLVASAGIVLSTAAPEDAAGLLDRAEAARLPADRPARVVSPRRRSARPAAVVAAAPAIHPTAGTSGGSNTGTSTGGGPSIVVGPAPRSRDLAVDLREAICTGQVRAVYQPIVDLGTGTLCGFEALARWEHPERGPVSPSVFVPLAEQTDLIAELGRLMLVTACQQVQTWRQAHPEHPVRVGVNVSPRQLASQTVLHDVRRALRFSGLPAEHLVVEVTESGVHRDLAGVRRLLWEMRELGVRTAMDDFGTGFSSLAYLRRLPLDIIKIDRCFVADVGSGGPGFLSAIVALGLELGLDTLAEGIETPDQLEAVVAAGCSFGQGYLMSRPLEADAAGLLVGCRDQLTPSVSSAAPARFSAS